MTNPYTSSMDSPERQRAATPEDRSAWPDPNPADLGIPAQLPSRATLRGGRVALRPIDPQRDASALFGPTHGDAEREAVWRYMIPGPFADQAEMACWLEACAVADDPHRYTVVDRSREQAVGVVAFTSIRPAMRVVEVGHIWYVPEAQRTGINTEALFLLLASAFDTLGYRRVEWKCDDQNARSRAAALRLGFVFEGIFRQHMIVKGRNRDTAWFAMLDGDWPAIRRGFEQFLRAPDDAADVGKNRDREDGGERASLSALIAASR